MYIRITDFLGFVQFLIQAPGHLEDLSAWGKWLKMLFFSDYLLWIVFGVGIVAILYKRFYRHVFPTGRVAVGSGLNPDITMRQLVIRAVKKFRVTEVEGVLWKALAYGRVTAWGRGKVFSQSLLDVHRTVLSPVVEKIPKEYWKYNKPDLTSVGLLGDDDTESALIEKGQRQYCKLRFNSDQLKKAGIF